MPDRPHLVRRAVGLLLLLGLITWLGTTLCVHYLSPAARARTAATEALTAATQGDVRTLAPFCAPDGLVTVDDLVKRYQGKKLTVFAVNPIGPNRTGVEVVALASWVGPDGVPHSTQLAMRRHQGRWVIVNEGLSLSF